MRWYGPNESDVAGVRPSASMGKSMADRNHLRAVDDFEFAENDPFAELTRIMGYDPREEEARTAAKAEPAPAEAPHAASEEYGIDLERELLGAFSGFDRGAEAHREAAPAPVTFLHRAPAPEPQPQDESLVDEAGFISDLESEMLVEGFADGDEQAEAGAETDRHPEAVHVVDDALHLQAEAEAEAEPEAETVPVTEAALPEPAAGELGEEPLAGQDWSSDVPDAPEATAAGSTDTDIWTAGEARPAQATAEEISLEDWFEEAETGFVDAPEPVDEAELEAGDDLDAADDDQTMDAFVPFAALPAAPAPSDDLDLDDAFANVDMDFAPSQVETRESTVDVAEPMVEETSLTPGLEQDALPDFEDELGALLDAGEEEEFVAPAETHVEYASAIEEAEDFADEVEADSEQEDAPFTPQSVGLAAASAAVAAGSPAWAARHEDAVAEVDEGLDIDLVDVPDEGVALTHDLDIPDIEYEAEAMVAADPFDEFEEALGAAYELNAYDPEPAPAAPAGADAYGDTHADYEADHRYAAAAAAAGAAGAAAMRQPHRAQAAYDDYEADQERYEPYQENLETPPAPPARPRSASRRGYWVAGLLAGVAIAGGAAVFAFGPGSGGGQGAPVIVRADVEPIKVRPENPGGVTVPNQDNPVYERVSGARSASAPTQERLVSGAEEPIDVAAAPVRRADEAIAVPPADAAEAEDQSLPPGVVLAEIPAADPEQAAVKNEDRVEPQSIEAAIDRDEAPILVEPRRVRTMVVRPDGTMVPREEPPVVAAAPEIFEAPQAGTEAAAIEPVAEEPAAPETVAEAPAVAAEAEPAVTASTPAPADTPTGSTAPARQVSATPSTGPVAPSRPAEQPVEIVGNVAQSRGTQVAALNPQAQAAPPAAAAGGWSMQIASQPSADGAQASYQDLARRYSSFLQGRGVNIVRAEIPGKGTFYRVRIPVGSRGEAVSLCERYKSAGGSCFVAQ